MKRSFFCVLVFLFISGPGYAVVPDLYRRVMEDPAMEQWVDSVFDSMTLSERVGQLFVLGSEVRVSPQQKALLKRYIDELKIGGLLFSKGVAADQAELTNYCQSLSKVPLMITLDGEWGLSMRLSDTPRFPVNMALGALADDSLLYWYGKEVGRECRRMGIHVNFAPVLDVNSNPDNPVIGWRSFGSDPESVARKAIAYARGLESEGVMAVGKHFPGHGDTSEDSHHTLPVVSQTPERLEEVELYPFRQYVDAGLSGMLSAHLIVPALDDKTGLPCSMSPVIVDTLLKQKMGFEGLVFTDALEMKGATGAENQAIKAILAGNDVILKPRLPLSQIKTVVEAVKNGDIPMSLIEEKCLKILRYKYMLGLNRLQKVDKKNLTNDLNTPLTEALNRKLHEQSITLLSDTGGIIPLKNLDSYRLAAVSVGNKGKDYFLETLGLYAPVKVFPVKGSLPPDKQKELLNSLDRYNMLIVGIHSAGKETLEQVGKISRGRNVVLVFFTSPYKLTGLRKTISEAAAVVLAYENNRLFQEYAAQVVFGGTGAAGKLPVSLNGLYASGQGVWTFPTRLGYTVPEEVGMDSRKLDKIGDIVERAIRKNAFPGCQVLVARKGKVVYNRSFGYFDYAGTRAVKNTDIYDLASITKATATLPAVMKLTDEGRLGLTERLSCYVPALQHTDKEDITVQSALYHESGMMPTLPVYNLVLDTASYPGRLFKKVRDADYRLRADRDLYAYNGIRFRPDLIGTELSDYYPVAIAENIYGRRCLSDSLFQRIVGSKLRPPGKYLYSCLNFVLLRKAVEEVTHERLDRYVDREFYRKLGADNLTFRPLKKISRSRIAPTENDMFLRKQILIGYTHDEMACFAGGVEGNAGLFGNANDLAKLLQMYLNRGAYGDERYIGEETADLFIRSKTPVSRRGLGFDKPDTVRPEKSPVCPEAPASVFGHTGYTGGCFWVDPDNQLVYVFLCNRVYAHRWNTNLMKLNVRPDIQSAIYQSFAK